MVNSRCELEGLQHCKHGMLPAACLMCWEGFVRLAVFSTIVYRMLPGAELGNFQPGWASPNYTVAILPSSSPLSQTLLQSIEYFAILPV